MRFCQSANVLVFADFNVHHKDWLTYSGRNGRPSEFWYNFLSQATLLSWLTFLLGFLILTIAVQLFWIYLFLPTSIVTFPPLENCDHVVTFSTGFTSNSKRDASFHRTAYNYSCTNVDSLHNHLNDVPLEHILKFGASNAATELCERVQVWIDVYIPS